MKRRIALVVLALLVGGGAYYQTRSRPTQLVLTGIVTTHDITVSSQIGGKLNRLLVDEADAVKQGELLAVIEPDELQADRAYYSHNVEGLAAQVKESEAALRYQERQTTDQIRQAEATLASTEAQQPGAAAELEHARLALKRAKELTGEGLEPVQRLDEAQATFEASRSRLDALAKEIDARRAAVALAHGNAEQVAMKRAQRGVNQQQLAAAGAQRTKAEVRLGYTEIRAPVDGIIDVRPVQPGEVVTAGQPLLTLINPDDLWVRADVEETYIDRVRLGDRITVRLPSGEERQGTVIYRGVDAGFATQRDVSRTKRDIKTFEIRLRVDNKDRRLAVGMTAYVLLPAGG